MVKLVKARETRLSGNMSRDTFHLFNIQRAEHAHDLGDASPLLGCVHDAVKRLHLDGPVPRHGSKNWWSPLTARLGRLNAGQDQEAT